jgi:ATP-dependent RNA helicase DDX56/DBP9
MSATTSEEVERLQKLVLHNHVTLNLLGGGSDDADEAGPGPGSAAEIDHFCVLCDRHAPCLLHAQHAALVVILKRASVGLDAAYMSVSNTTTTPSSA